MGTVWVQYGIVCERQRAAAVEILGYKEMLRSPRKFCDSQDYWSGKHR
jgi:hypothetical protein